MKDYNVVMPVGTDLTIDERYDAVLAHLDERKATLHMIAQADNSSLGLDRASLTAIQSEQVDRMAVCLKCEALDRFAQTIQARYPNLEFDFHADTQPLDRQLLSLNAHLEPHAVLVDSRTIPAGTGSPVQAALQSLVNGKDLPIWHIDGEAGDPLSYPGLAAAEPALSAATSLQASINSMQNTD